VSNISIFYLKLMIINLPSRLASTLYQSLDSINSTNFSVAFSTSSTYHNHLVLHNITTMTKHKSSSHYLGAMAIRIGS
jgi:hypothetical protein